MGIMRGAVGVIEVIGWEILNAMLFGLERTTNKNYVAVNKASPIDREEDQSFGEFMLPNQKIFIIIISKD